MRKSYTSRQVALRFKRWSRKRYAAFISVQRAVTIGQLTSNIIDRFQKKNLSLHTGICMLMDDVFGTDEEESTDISGKEVGLSLSEWRLLSILPAQVSNETAHPAGYTYIIYKNKRWNVSSGTFHLFFIIPNRTNPAEYPLPYIPPFVSSCRDGACPVSTTGYGLDNL